MWPNLTDPSSLLPLPSALCHSAQWKGLAPESQDSDMRGVRHRGTWIRGGTFLCMHFDLWTLTYEPFVPHATHDRAVKISLIKNVFSKPFNPLCCKVFDVCCITIQSILQNHSIRIAKPFDPHCKTIWSTLQTVRSALQNYSIWVAKPFNPMLQIHSIRVTKPFDPRSKLFDPRSKPFDLHSKTIWSELQSHSIHVVKPFNPYLLN